MEDKQLSILNPEPRKLPGLELLHLLVSGAKVAGTDQAVSDQNVASASRAEREAQQTPALDYRAPDGTRITLSYPDLHQIAGILAAEILERLPSVVVTSDDSAEPTNSEPSAPAPKELVVPVLIPQAPELYVSLLAILKAGGAFCPIQLDAPPDRIRFILGDVGADVVLTTSAMAERLPEDIRQSLEVIFVDELDLFDGVGQKAMSNISLVSRPVGPDDLAYVMYTSGSTGTPKGVGVPHGAATQSLLSHDRHVPTFQRFLQFAAPTFDVSVFEIFFPWFRGSTLVCCSRAEMLDDLPAVITSLNVDACELTPTVAGSLLQSRANAPGLRLLLTIGEMLTEPVVREFGASPDQPSILWAMYGPTEAAIHCTLQPALNGAASVKNIGFPLDTVSAYIVAIPDEEAGISGKDGSGGPLIMPLGEVGELAVGGYQLARGYINRPEQTAAAFIDTRKYGRLYRTGDKARITDQGILECSGRLAGGQIKLRGQRIELGEVEQAVLRADGCLGSVAAVINGILVAFCDVGPKAIPDAASNRLEEGILESCRSWLPRFMIPGDIVLMPDFPRLASGKVDRKRLASEYAETNTQQTTEASQSEFKDDLERELHDIAQSVLGSSINSTASLAAAGLDSLKAIRFAASIRKSGLSHVSAVDVLESKTIAALHSRIQQSAPEPEATHARTLDDTIDVASLLADSQIAREHLKLDEIESVLECTPIQTAMLAETLADPRAYCNWVELGVKSSYDAATIKAALRRIILDNEILRASFVQYKGRFVQAIRREAAENQIRVIKDLQRDFQLDTDVSMLMPFFVEIEDVPAASEHRRVILHLHHAVYDGWSADLLRSDFYSYLQGEASRTPTPYTSVVRHFRSIGTAQHNAAERFWTETLNGYQLAALPELNPRRDVTGHILTKVSTLTAVDGTSIDRAQVDRLATAVGCSTQALFQAALAWLWSGLVGSSDVVLGTVTSGRTIPVDGIETIMGPCLQTVPLRADLSRMRTIRDLLSSIHTSNRALLAHAFLPLSEIKKIAGVRPGQPLYDVLFVYQESMYSQTNTNNTVVELDHKDYLETKLLWEVEPRSQTDENGGTFRIRTTFYVDTFPEAQVETLMAQYAAVFGHMIANLDEAISSLYTELPTALQSRHNLDYRSFDGCPDLAQLVQETAKRTPNRSAVCFATAIEDGPNGGDGSLQCTTVTFDELNRLANRIARCLRQSLGVKTGDAVAIVMEKSVLLYAGILGILKAGCAYLPLLPTTPLARVQTILEQSGVHCTISDTPTLSSISSLNICPVFDLQSADLGAFSDADFDGDEVIPADPARIANIVYTSGSTGVPKGVCVTQLNICSNLDVLSRIYPVSHENGGRLLQSCSQAFDVSVFEIFFSWVYGLCLCSATNDVLFADLERAIRLFGVTHLSMTPTVAGLVDPKNTPSVEFLVTAGEPLTERVATTWSKQLFQGYGPSETTNICTVKKMALRDTIRHLGFAFENTSTVVLNIGDESGATVPLGAVGEFCFGGDQVVAGYLGLPELTAENFIDHPLYGRLYRSGDIGRMLPDGSLMITGRIDDQIKLRGQRIELNEINAVLCASPLVSKAATSVVRQEGASGVNSELLAAFFVPASSDSATFHLLEASQDLTASLFRDLQSRLPVYMVPTFLVPMANVPLTPAGKVNKALLLDTFRGLTQDQLSGVANSSGHTEDGDSDATQWTDLERDVCNIVVDVLKTDDQNIGRWTPLASLGLDSLSAIQVARRLSESVSKTRLAISDILRNMSVAQLAQLIKDKTDAAADTSSSSFSLDVFSAEFLAELKSSLDERGLSSTKPALPCMPLQEAMLVSPTRGKSYVNSMLFRLTAPENKIQAAWREICARQDILRTCFVTTDHPTYPIAQVILVSYTASWLDLKTSSTESLDALVEQHAQSLSNPVDSFQPPVSFATIKDGQATYLSFVCHHAVYDGEAMGRLLWEVEQLLNQTDGHLETLKPAPQFSTFLKQALDLPPSTDKFWSDHLDGYQPTLLLANKSAGAELGGGVLTQSLNLPLSSIQIQVQGLGYSLLTACQAAWAVTMSILLQTDDICFGNVYNGRSVAVEDVDSLVAPCFNTLPVRANLSTLTSNRDLLSYFQDLNPDLLLHQFTPLRHIQRQHSNGRRLFDSLLLLQQPSRPLDKNIWTLERDDGEMDLPIVFELVPNNGEDKIEAHLHYDKYVSSGLKIQQEGIPLTWYIQIFTNEAPPLVVELFSSILTMLLQFSSSHIPGRNDLPQSLQDSLQNLHLEVEAPRDDNNDGELASNTNQSVEIWSHTESTIRAVLSQLASVPADKIRRDTTIYRLGLDSVRAVQVASALRKQGLQVSAVDVMEHPSCMALASFLAPPPPPATLFGTITTANGSEFMTSVTSDMNVHTPPSSSASAASPVSLEPQTLDFEAFRAAARPVLDKNGFFLDDDIEAVLPCTPLQVGLLTEFVRSKGKHYFNFITFESTAGLDGQVWESAWKHAASTIPMLRTGFISMDGAGDNDGDDDAFSGLSPYAMIQITPESIAHQSRVVRVEENNTFDLAAWKVEATAQALHDLQLPPWQIVIVEGHQGQGVACHLAIHHALYDAHSLRRLLDDVAGSIKNGSATEQERERAQAPTTAAVVSDIIHQVATLTGPSSSIASLWREKSAHTVVNSFPVLTPLKELPGHGVLSRSSSQSLGRLQAAVKNAGFTMHAVLQAAWTRILSSYVGDASVVFGAVLSGRNTDTIERSVFPCISTLPVVAQNNASNRLLVEQLMDANILLHKSQHVPLRQIQRWLGQPDARLFDTLVVYQSSGTGPSSDYYPWSVVDEQAVVDYPVSIEAITELPDQPLLYQITFDTGVLPTEHASVLLGQLDAIVNHIATHPDGSEDDLVASSPELYSILPPSAQELPSDVKLLHEFVERQAELRPTKTALQFVTAFDESAGGVPVSKEWSFRELNARGNQVASIVSKHAEPESIVAVCFDKCPEAFFAILGILKAGCAYLALDPGAPSARKEFILQDAGAPLLLTDSSKATASVTDGGLSDIADGVKVLAIDEASLSTSKVTSFTSARPTVPSDVCYCLYTSGTTGTPKGCAITHENAVQCMLAFQELFRNHYDTNTSRWLQFASFHFDVAVLEQYWTWSVGMTLVGAPRDLILEDLAGTISRLDITHIDLTPSLGRLLDPADVPSLCRGVFITGGEPLKQEMLDPWGPTGAVHNFYGPTEATIGVTSYPQVPQNGRASNIGRQFPNVGTLVFRPGTQTPVLRGGVGELCVSGKLVGKGYLNREELTNERFPALEGVFRNDHGDRAYRTGDLVRMLHDGCFDFLGRADDQVKLRGQRLEIGEINHAICLGLGESVGDVATLVIRDEENKKDFLVSFVVVDEAGDTTDSAALSSRVQNACRERLPGYMVPTYIVQLASIPLSPNNKADGKELKRFFNSLTPDERMRTTGAAGTAVSTSTNTPGATSIGDHPTGKIVIQVLHKLGLLDPKDNELAPHTSIFELGIDSVSVLRFARALKRAGLPSATPSVILAHPNMGDLVAVLHDTQKKQSSSIGSVLEAQLLVDACQHRNRTRVCQVLGVQSDQIEYIAPCSALQQGIISRARSGPEHKDTYFNAFHFELAGTTSVDRLRDAWSAVVDNNAILRTRFVATGDGFVQVSLKPTAANLPWIHLDHDEDANIDNALKEQYRAWVDANQDDAIASPLQLVSIRHGEKHTLVLHIFHGLYDASSLDLVLSQVVEAYNNTVPASSGPTFLDALVHGPLRNHNTSRPFWESHLKGWQSSAAQPLQPLAASQETVPDIGISLVLPFAAVEHLRVSLGVSHAALVQALWVSALQKTVYNAHAGIPLGLVLSGRTMDDLDGAEQVAGPLFNTLPFFAHVSNMSWAELAQACHAFGIASLPFQQTPLRDIQKWCSSGQPLFDVLFSFHLGDESAPNQNLWTQSEPDVHADYPLALEAVLTPASSASSLLLLKLFLVAKSGLEISGQLNSVLDAFGDALEAMSKDPSSPAFDGISSFVPTKIPEPAAAPASTTKDSSTSKTSFAWNDTATTLRTAIAALAGVPDDAVQETTTLIELGLDSVDTIKLSARLRAAGTRLTNSQLVRGQTIVAFLDIIGANSDNANKRGDVDSSSSPDSLAATSAALHDYFVKNGRDLSSISHLLPPTPLQEAMVADMIQSDFALYFNNDILEIAPEVDVVQLKAAWASVIAKHAILRTVFFNIDSPDFDIAYCQAVKTSVKCITEHQVATKDDLSKIADNAKQLAIQGEGESGLFQLSFVQTVDTDRWYLVLSISHALYDGWSLDLLHRTVEAAYHNGDDTSSPSPPAYINQLGRILQSSGSQADTFWKSFLDGAQPTHVQKLPTSTLTVQSTKMAIRLESTSAVSVADLQAFSRQHAASIQVIGQACWAAVLSSLTKSLDLLFGVVLSGRDLDGADNTIFPTMNTVPIRVVLHGSTPDLLHYMQTNMGSVGEHQYYPLRKAQRAVARIAGGDSAESGIFNTLFILQKRLDQEATGDSVLTTSIGGASDVEYPICVEMELVHDANQNKDAIVWRTACDQAYVTRHGAARLLHQLDTALLFMVKSGPTSVLSFDNDGVSVCGLPPFTPNMQREVKMASHDEPEEPVTDDSDWTPDELAIREVLSAVSGTPESAIQRTGQTLYHLGLDSISTIKVSTLLKKQKGIVLGVRALLGAASIQEMATLAKRQKIAEQPPNQSAPSIISPEQINAALQTANISPYDVQTVLPATAMQVHMVSVWQNTNGDIFFPTFSYRLKSTNPSTLSLQGVYNAWSQLVAEQPILRTVFLVPAEDAGVPLLQAVIRTKTPPALDNTKSTQEWPALGDSTTPSFATLSVTQETIDSQPSFLLTLRIHHALYDAVSLETLLGRFKQLINNPSSDNSKATSIAWEQSVSRQLSTPTTDSNKKFWTKYFAGANIKSTASQSEYNGRASCYRPAAFDNVSSLKGMAAALGVGLQSLVFAVYARTLVTPENEDVIFGVYLANRDEADSDDQLAGYPTLCLVPLLIRSPAKRTLPDIATQIQADLHALSSPSSAVAAPLTASLWEIQQWTGVTVDSFVNFLPGEAASSGETGVELEAVESTEQTTVLSPSSYPALAANRVRGAYVDAVDVELAARDGRLDIGVFGSKSRLGDDNRAEKMVDEIVKALKQELIAKG